MMMQAHIDADLVDRYLRRQLGRDEQDTVEAHLLDCDECFAAVQDADRFEAGVRDAARRGLLDDDMPARRASGGASWLQWAFATTALATIAFTATTAWMYFAAIPRLRADLDRARMRPVPSEPSRSPDAAPQPEGAEANVAVAMLNASRAADTAAKTTLAPGARHLLLWIEVGPARFQRFEVDVTTPDNRLIARLDGVERGPYGALAATLPAAELPAGEVRITVSGQEPPPAALVGEYRLIIQRP
jgi:Putative zinc-finger